MAPNPDRASTSKRRHARQMALQALYQWQMNETPTDEIESQFLANNDMTQVDSQYFHILLHNIPRQFTELDLTITPFLDRPLARLDPIERAILRIGCYELLYQKEVPYRVVINESIELSKCFGAQDSHRYINGILDKLVSQLRHEEYETKEKP